MWQQFWRVVTGEHFRDRIRLLTEENAQLKRENARLKKERDEKSHLSRS